MDLLVTTHKVSPAPTARNLGVVLDDQLSCNADITSVARSCRIALHNIRKIRPFLTHKAAQILVQALVITRLDYCNSLLAGLPAFVIKPLLCIQNTAACLVVFNLPKFSLVTPLFRDLHWLPVISCIRFKTLVLADKAVSGTAPTYLQTVVRLHAPARALRSTTLAGWLVPPSLRTATTLLCQVPTLLCSGTAVVEWAPGWRQAAVTLQLPQETQDPPVQSTLALTCAFVCVGTWMLVWHVCYYAGYLAIMKRVLLTFRKDNLFQIYMDCVKWSWKW